jgi:hypothetical protein
MLTGRLPVRTGVAVQQLTGEDGTYRITTDRETFLARMIADVTENSNARQKRYAQGYRNRGHWPGFGAEDRSKTGQAGCGC